MVTTVRSANAVITTFCRMFSCEKKHTQSVLDCQLKNVMSPCKPFDEEHSVVIKACSPKPKKQMYCTLLLIGTIKRYKENRLCCLGRCVWLVEWMRRNSAKRFFFFSYRCHVDGRRGLVHDEDAALTHKGSGEAEELPLAYAEVLSSFSYHCIYRGFKVFRCSFMSKHSIYYHKGY